MLHIFECIWKEFCDHFCRALFFLWATCTYSMHIELIFCWNDTEYGTHFILRRNEKPSKWKLLVLWLQCTNEMKLAKCWLLYALCTLYTYSENAHRPNTKKNEQKTERNSENDAWFIMIFCLCFWIKLFSNMIRIEVFSS